MKVQENLFESLFNDMIDKETKNEEVKNKLVELITWQNTKKGTIPGLLRLNNLQKNVVLKTWKSNLHNSNELIKVV